MSRVVYSLRIFSSAGLTPSAGLVGPVVPTGFVYVCRSLLVVHRGTATGDGLFWISPTLGLNLFIGAGICDVAGNYQWNGHAVYNEGEQVGFESAAGTWDLEMSGYQLTLP